MNDKKSFNKNSSDENYIEPNSTQSKQEKAETQNTEESTNNTKLENIEKSGSVVTENDGVQIKTITIIGQIEGHQALTPSEKATKYEHIIPELVDAEQNSDIHGILIILNTAGGDVEAGLALAELISSMKTPTTTLVLGGGHSIGVPLAVSGKKSFIVKSGAMTLHPVRMNGLVIGVPQQFRYFDKIQDRIVSFVVANSNITEDRFRALINNKDDLISDVGTILDGKSAVSEGLIDSLGGLSDALDYLYKVAKEYKKNPNNKYN